MHKQVRDDSHVKQITESRSRSCRQSYCSSLARTSDGFASAARPRATSHFACPCVSSPCRRVICGGGCNTSQRASDESHQHSYERRSLDRLNSSVSGDEMPLSDGIGLRCNLKAERDEHQDCRNAPQQVTSHMNLRYISLCPDGKSCSPVPTCGVWECEDDRQANTCCPDKVEDPLLLLCRPRANSHL